MYANDNTTVFHMDVGIAHGSPGYVYVYD